MLHVLKTHREVSIRIVRFNDHATIYYSQMQNNMIVFFALYFTSGKHSIGLVFVVKGRKHDPVIGVTDIAFSNFSDFLA